MEGRENIDTDSGTHRAEQARDEAGGTILILT